MDLNSSKKHTAFELGVNFHRVQWCATKVAQVKLAQMSADAPLMLPMEPIMLVKLNSTF